MRKLELISTVVLVVLQMAMLLTLGFVCFGTNLISVLLLSTLGLTILLFVMLVLSAYRD